MTSLTGPSSTGHSTQVTVIACGPLVSIILFFSRLWIIKDKLIDFTNHTKYNQTYVFLMLEYWMQYWYVEVSWKSQPLLNINFNLDILILGYPINSEVWLYRLMSLYIDTHVLNYPMLSVDHCWSRWRFFPLFLTLRLYYMNYILTH